MLAKEGLLKHGIASTYRGHGQRARHGAYRKSLSEHHNHLEFAHLPGPRLECWVWSRTGHVGIIGALGRVDVGDRCGIIPG
jgi:hypothetical protein